MKIKGTLLLFWLAIPLALSACNLPGEIMDGEPNPNTLMVSVSTETGYRSGPGPAYDVLGVLQPGQQVEAVGRSPEGDYLVIRNPDDPTSLAWLPSEDIITTGNCKGLPTAVPPPMPMSI